MNPVPSHARWQLSANAPSVVHILHAARCAPAWLVQVGVDDRLLPWFKEVKAQAADAVAAEGGAAESRAFARFGVPQGARPRVWESALGLAPAGEEEYAQFEALCQLVRACGPRDAHLKTPRSGRGRSALTAHPRHHEVPTAAAAPASRSVP